MAILIALLVVVGACYSPDLPDCRVHCETAADCAPGQSCTGSVCSGAALCPSDVAPTDASPVDVELVADAPTPIDAPGLGVLVVKIEDHGQVAVPGGGSCSDAAAGHTCMFGVTLGIATTLTATPGNDRVFVSWAESCAGTDPTCVLTPTMPMTHVTAKFHKDD